MPRITKGQVWMFGKLKIRVAYIDEQGSETIIGFGPTTDKGIVLKCSREEFWRKIIDWDAKLMLE